MRQAVLGLSLISLLLVSCGDADVTEQASEQDSTKSDTVSADEPSVTALTLSNDTLIVTGKNLEHVDGAALGLATQNAAQASLAIHQKSSAQLILKISTALQWVLGALYNLTLNTANAATSVPVSISFVVDIEDGGISLVKLASDDANHGDVITYNEDTGKWEPKAPATFSLSDNAVTTAKIQAGAVTSAKVVDAAITAAKMADGAVTAAKLNQMSATNGQVLTWNNTTGTWAPQAAAGGTVTAILLFAFAGTLSGTNTTRYSMWSLVPSDQEVDGIAIIPVDGTLKNLRARLEDAEDGTIAITVSKNGTETAMTVTFANAADGATANDLTNTVTVAPGDRISFKNVMTVQPVQAEVAASVELHYTAQ